MEPELKQRLIGASVLTVIAAFLIPVFLSDHPVTLQPKPEPATTTNSIEPVSKIEEEAFNSSLEPIVVETEDTSLPETSTSEPSQQDEAKLSATSVDADVSPETGPEETNTVTAPAKEPVSAASKPKPATEIIETVEDPIGDFIKQQSEPDKLISEAESSAEVKTSLGATRAWVVQLGSFSSNENAEGLHQRLQEKGFQSFIEPVTNNTTSATSYRVRVGPPSLDKTEAQAVKEQIKATLNLDGYLVEYP